MRDLVVTLLIFGSLPFIVARPWIGVLVWAWLSYMNPHRLTFGFAYSFPFAAIVAAVTMASILFSREKKSIPWVGVTVVWAFWVLWMNVSTYFAMNHDPAVTEWDRSMKIQLIVLVTLMLIRDRMRVQLLVWTIALSLGFFGARGGVFALLTGGEDLVFGPPESFITDNNTLALALVMTLPLMRYLQVTAEKKWMRVGLLLMAGLTLLSIIASQSRGAFLASSVMIAFLVLKSRHKLRFMLFILAALPFMLMVMPASWFERMSTISEYQEDASALGRINAWYMAVNLAADHPFVGAGFQAFTPENFERYAPEPENVHDAHSIYFEVMAEHGFVGLGLFLLLGFLTLRMGTRVIKLTAGHESLAWARDLAAMLQVSLIGYAVGGAFLGLAYFDLFYHLVVIMVIVHKLVNDHLAELAAAGAGAGEGAASAKVPARPAWRDRVASSRGLPR